MFEDFRLRVFMTVAEEGSFTKAAAVLKVTQPAVSQNIAELERSCGMKLFERQRGEVILTSEGMVFQRYAGAILDAYAAAGRMFVPLQPQKVRISVSEDIYTFIIYPVLKDFLVIHPGIAVERVLRPEDADLTILLHPSPSNPFDILPDSIARVTLGLSPAPRKTGDLRATRESVSYHELLFRPAPDFALTPVCSLLREFLSSAIS